MKLTQTLLASLILAALATSGVTAGIRTIVISGFDTMKYSVNTIEAHPGEKITVELKNEGTMPKEAMGHNWVLLKAGVDPQAYANAAVAAKAEGYQPSSLADKVIATIRVLGPKESGSVTFTAPSTPGKYAYLCSFPAHCQVGMRGFLVVK
jgi:azurin